MREPVHIIDNIWIADNEYGDRYDLLQLNGFRHVVSLMPENRSAMVRQRLDDLGITHRHLTVTDHPRFPITLYLGKTFWVLGRCDHKRLVVDRTGDNHAIAILINYMAHRYGLTVDEAVRFISAKIPCCISQSAKYQIRDVHEPWLQKLRRASGVQDGTALHL